MSLTILTKNDYQNHISTIEHRAFLQSLEMADLYDKRGYQPQILGLVKNGQVTVAALVYKQKMLGGHLLSLDYGPVYQEPSELEEFYEELKTYAKKTGALVLQVKPYDNYQVFDTNGQPTSEERTDLITQLTSLGYEHCGLYTGYPNGEASWNYVKDLAGISSDKLVNSFSKKGKPVIKKTKTFGIELKRLERHELSEFKKVSEDTSTRRSFDDRPLEYYENLYDSFGDKADFMAATINFETYLDNLTKDQGKLKVKIDKLAADIEANPNSEKKKNQHRELSSQFDTFTVRIQEAKELLEKYGKEDVVLAASIFIFMPNESYYFLSGSYTEFNKFYAPALLQEYAMLKSIELGIPTYNFFGIAGEFDNTDGVLKFKQNFNGYITRKMGAFRYYPNPLKYKLISLVKKILRR